MDEVGVGGEEYADGGDGEGRADLAGGSAESGAETCLVVREGREDAE